MDNKFFLDDTSNIDVVHAPYPHRDVARTYQAPTSSSFDCVNQEAFLTSRCLLVCSLGSEVCPTTRIHNPLSMYCLSECGEGGCVMM